MNSRAKWLAFALVVLAPVVVGGASIVQDDRVLLVERADTGESLLAVPVENGTTVALEYEHSVEHSRVLDVYEVRGDELVNTRMEFADYGWGFPAQANVSREDGKFVYEPEPAQRLEEVYVKPGRIAGHRLHVGDRTYDLVELSNAETVRVHVERRTAIERITG